MIYTFYRQATGEVTRIVSAPSAEEQLLEGEAFVVAVAPENSYVQDGEFVPIPPQPSSEHWFNFTTKQWEEAGDTPENLERRATALRKKRDALLAKSDILLIRAIEDGQDITALKAYREALRDMGSQAHLRDPVWPVVPT